jgi:hypothetical protein
MNYTDRIGFKDLFTEDGVKVQDRKAVVNLDDSNAVLGVVSPRYKIIHNTDLVKAVDPVLQDLNLGLDKTSIKMTKGGAVTFFTYMSEKVTGEVQKGDIVRFGIQFFNSYDGSTPVGFHIIAERLVCTNGLVVPKSMMEIYMRHTGSASVGHIRNRVADYLPRTQEAINLWKNWASDKPQENRLESFLEDTPLIGERLTKNLMGQYRSLPEEKKNLWEFYNLITYHLTHTLKVRKEADKEHRQFFLNEQLTNRLSNHFA